jgi:hypothetical protein
MADLTRIPFTPPPAYTGEPDTWAPLLAQYLGEQLELLQSLTGGALRWQNLRSELILDQTLGAGTAPFNETINHSLGTIPATYVVMPITAPVTTTLVWAFHATVADRAAWTASSIRLTYDDSTHLSNPTIKYDIWLVA